MGCDVEFYAFREAPDVAKLQSTKWLPAWRLFKQKDANAWYLEGPTENASITFFEPLHLHGAKPPMSAKIKAQAKAIRDRIKQEGGDVNLFDEYALRMCASLSAQLGQPVMFAGGNDEGFDCFISCEEGSLVEAKSDIHWYMAIVVGGDGTISIDQFFDPKADQNALIPRRECQSASEGTAAFFGADDWTITSDPHDFDASSYELVAEHGEAPQAELSLSEALFKRFGAKPQPRELLDEIAPYVDGALAEDLSDAENERRFDADTQTGQLVVYLGYCRQKPAFKHRHLMGALKALLSDLSGYTLALRPKPQFRKDNTGLERQRQALAMRWKAIKLEGRILG